MNKNKKKHLIGLVLLGLELGRMHKVKSKLV